MSEPIIAAESREKDLELIHDKIGISYSGGGPLVVIELGIAQAFVEMGIHPHVIAGTSAGALAGAAHALDIHGGTGIAMAAGLLKQIDGAKLGFGWVPVIERLVAERENFTSLADNQPLKPMITEALKAFREPGSTTAKGLENVTIGYFSPPRPKVLILATNRGNGDTVVFPRETRIEDAVVASSAIPGVFPWQHFQVGPGPAQYLVDGGVVTNQPLQRLVLEHCGQIYVCAVGYAGGDVPPPTNALNNVVESINLMAHQCTKLEEAYVREWVGDQGIVYPHIHPQLDLPIQNYNFAKDPDLVDRIMKEAKSQTLSWLANPPPGPVWRT